MAEGEKSAPTEEGRSWLRRRLAELLGRGARGDVIAAYVGPNARDVIVGKNIVKVGTLVVPTLPLLALLAVVVSALGFWGANFLGPAKMSSTYNVAVAGIGQLDTAGRMHRSELGELSGGWIFEDLVDQNDKQAVVNRVEIWHDSLPITQKRVRLGFIAGATPEERAAAAEALAARVRADVVIYGYLSPDSAAPELIVEFYVSSRLSGESAEIIGRYQLGDPIPVPPHFDVNDSLAKEKLGSLVATRGAAAFWLVLGLRDDLLGEPAKALAVLQQAEQQLPLWKPRGEGKEILYYLMGREALFLERDEQAEEAAARALDSNPGYARAEIVMGGVYLRRAKQALAPDGAGVDESLRLSDVAIGHYGRALQPAPASAGPLIETVARLALGSAYYLQGEAYLILDDVEAAGRLFGQTVAEVEPLLAPLDQAGQHRLLAQAYGYLGMALYQQGWLSVAHGNQAAGRALYEQARDAYARCLEQGQAAPEDDLLRSGTIAESCRRNSAAAEQALSSLEGNDP